jgi:hypothetical protein
LLGELAAARGASPREATGVRLIYYIDIIYVIESVDFAFPLTEPLI